MYRCRIAGADNTGQYEELIKVFLQPLEYEIVKQEAENQKCITYTFDGDKDDVKRRIYRDLEKLTGKSPKWGILTGIRPIKMAGELYRRSGSFEVVEDALKKDYFLHDEKVHLVTDILKYQLDTAGLPDKNSLSVYIGIPFCPTRCLYCSFTSNQVADSEIERYLEALHKEIEYASAAIKKEGYKIESIYIGGGTPTTLNERQLTGLLKNISRSFNIKTLKEFTVEAGRPDTITSEKLKVIRESGVDRISINPQSMKQETLEVIGRAHTVKDIERAFSLAKREHIGIINTDLIAGLPGENFEDFKNSISEILRLEADNITLHTLAVKRASRLREMDENFNYRDEELRERMLSYALDALKEKGYEPYYLYRQKHTSGNTENIGFCKNDKVSLYNIRIMEEAQSILALGAGGISKVYFPKENRLERVANVSNYEIYIERIDEMIERKEKGFFGVDR